LRILRHHNHLTSRPYRLTCRLRQIGGAAFGSWNAAGLLSSSARIGVRQRILLLRHRFAEDRLVDREDVA
jgi:hypothetical protein